VRHKAKHGVTIGERFVHLEERLVAELSGIGLWVDNAGPTAAETVDLILGDRGRARLG
jgi:hypothetical protein